MLLYICIGLLALSPSINGAVTKMKLHYARTEILKKYPRNIYTTNDVNAKLQFQPLSISHLDATARTFSFTANFQLAWTDPYLIVNATELEHERTYLLIYSSAEILTPVIALMNSAFGNAFVRIGEDIPLLVNMDGEILVQNIIGVKTKCNVDITRFPFDEQICKVVFEEYIGSLNVTVSDFFLDIYNSGHTEWQVISLDVSKDKRNSQEHIIQFHLRRQSSFYVMGIVFPMILLSFLNSFVFLLPAESGEKISFLVSIFVTYAVFLNFVNDMIPKSDRMPRLALYLVSVQCHSTMCILATLFMLNRHHKEREKQGIVKHHQEDLCPTVGQDNGRMYVLETANAPGATDIPQSRKTKVCGDRVTSVNVMERMLFLTFFFLAALLTLVFFI